MFSLTKRTFYIMELMIDEIEYQIYIGCSDSQTSEELISSKQLRILVSLYFERLQIGFSMQEVKGGYVHTDGKYVIENTLCITIIGAQGLNIVELANGLSMYMNQDCLMVTKNGLKMEYR